MNDYGFRKLAAWQKAKALAVEVYHLTKPEGGRGDGPLNDQIRRCAMSVAGSIAEGEERSADKDSLQFFQAAKGSVAELVTRLEIAREVGCFIDAEIKPLILKCAEVSRLLDTIIRVRSEGPVRVLRPSPWT